HAISGTPLETFSNSAEQRLGQLRSEFAYAQVKQVLASGLHEFLDAFQTKLNLVGDDIYKTFFALRPVNGEPAAEQSQSQSSVIK
ncbi:hypothetical protein C6499_21075, partial [Candidatus Poribacteria bacterium]